MRSMQFGGKPIEQNPSRLFNCSYVAIEHIQDFWEVMYLLLGGVGVGISVQRIHISKLPSILKPGRERRFLIGDSIEGWADAVKRLIKAYFLGISKPLFDFSDIRKKGDPLITAGGKAPGPEPLKRCLNKIEAKLSVKKIGDQLSSLEIYDIICLIADAVLSGGIRRSAIITFFDSDDEDMLESKQMVQVIPSNGGFYWNTMTKMYEGEVVYEGKSKFCSLTKSQFKDYQKSGKLPWYFFALLL